MAAEPTDPSSGVRPPGPQDILRRLTELGDLIEWIEMEDDGLHFQCWRLNPERYPEDYQVVPKYRG